MYVVTRQQLVSKPIHDTWTYLTDPSKLCQWLADVDTFALGRDIRLEFGDGDFFYGRVLEQTEPTFLALRWKFLGVGPEFHIRFSLFPLEDRTELTVQDIGAPTLEEAQSLRDGWRDFLQRLEQYVRQGQRTRYEWNPIIAAAALVERASSSFVSKLQDRNWWESITRDNSISSITLQGSQFVFVFQDKAWQGLETRAVITSEHLPIGVYIRVTHEGWLGLPQDIRLKERRRYAEWWSNRLKDVERRGKLEARR